MRIEKIVLIEGPLYCDHKIALLRIYMLKIVLALTLAYAVLTRKTAAQLIDRVVYAP